jgi:hypothetical protein
MHWELGVCLPLRRAGWRLIYDPAVAVDHDIAPRLGADTLHRGVFTAGPLVDAVHNETLALLEGRSMFRRLAILAWALLVGTREGPGVAQWVRARLASAPHATAAWSASRAGRLAGWRTSAACPRRLDVPRPGA